MKTRQVSGIQALPQLSFLCFAPATQTVVDPKQDTFLHKSCLLSVLDYLRSSGFKKNKTLKVAEDVTKYRSRLE